MFPHRDASLSYGSAHATSVPAGAHGAESNGAANVDVESVVERVNAYGFHAGSVNTTGVWWVPFRHPSSVSPLTTGVQVTWAL